MNCDVIFLRNPDLHADHDADVDDAPDAEHDLAWHVLGEKGD